MYTYKLKLFILRYDKIIKSSSNAIILKDRTIFREFYHLFNQLRSNNTLFRSYTRMSIET